MHAAIGLITSMAVLVSGPVDAGAGEVSSDRFTITYEGVSAEKIADFHRQAIEAYAMLEAHLPIRQVPRIHIRIGPGRRAPSVDVPNATLSIDANRFRGRASGPSGVIGRVPAIVHDLADILLPSRNLDWAGMLQYGLGVYLQERFGKGAPAYPAMGREIHSATAAQILASEGFVRLQDSARRLERLPFGRAHRLTMLHQGSFAKFLIERHGLDKFLRVHLGRRFAEAYGTDLCGLESQWVAFITERFPATRRYAEVREPCTEF